LAGARPGKAIGRSRAEEAAMADDRIDDLKGRAKEAAGDLTGNDDLEREGKADQAGASVKEKVNKVADKVKDKVDDLKK
jgi:uncharacterized protein YjbJ (UPF0337 family)